jgi:hypothetical protein
MRWSPESLDQNRAERRRFRLTDIEDYFDLPLPDNPSFPSLSHRAVASMLSTSELERQGREQPGVWEFVHGWPNTTAVRAGLPVRKVEEGE